MLEAILLTPQDNVAVALRHLKAGEKVKLGLNQWEGEVREVELRDEVPFGHKFAVENINKGASIIKYGETIGKAVKDIKVGEHVHVHNVESLRGRGDLNSLAEHA